MIEKTIIALKIIDKTKHSLTAKQFAKLMWPNSPCWKKHYKGNSSSAVKGKGMWVSSGFFFSEIMQQRISL